MYFQNQIMTRRVDNTACDLTSVFLKSEYLAFPVSAHDDMLDCLSRIVDPELNAVFPREQQERFGHITAYADTNYDLFAW